MMRVSERYAETIREHRVPHAKEIVNENDVSRKRFEVLAREVFKKFKACLTINGVTAYRRDYDAINVIYKSLQEDRDKADISEIIRELHRVVDEAITPAQGDGGQDRGAYDISKIDFDRLREEFARSSSKRTSVQNLKQVVEKRLERLLEQNPLRTDFQRHFEEIVDAYNSEKDRLTIETTFEQLLRFNAELDEESGRAMREGLDEETQALFDLLRKPELKKADIDRIKKVAVELLATLKVEKLRIDHWREKEATRDAVRVAIKDFLWKEETGLPLESYTDEDVEAKTEEVFRHVWRAYPTLPSPLYSVH